MADTENQGREKKPGSLQSMCILALQAYLLSSYRFTDESIAFQVQYTVLKVLFEGITEGDFCRAWCIQCGMF